MKLIPAEETSRRARVAIAHDGGEHEDIQPRTGISSATFNRIVAKTNPRAATLDELHAIADACGVPRRFMEEGFAALGDDEVKELRDRLDLLASQLDGAETERAELRQRIDALEAALGSDASEG